MSFELTNKSTTTLYGLGFVGLFFALPSATAWWVLSALLIHCTIIAIFSGVTHRHFCHRAYEAKPSLAWAASVLPVAYGYASPIAWAAMHSAHHAYADTDKDPHISSWWGLFTANYRFPPKKFLRASMWFADGKHRFIHQYALLVVLCWNLILLCHSVDAMLWLGLVPMFTLKFGDGLHRVFSHGKSGARNLWFMEYIVPMGGEWIHDEHHQNARKPIYANHWYELDTGGLIIRALSK